MALGDGPRPPAPAQGYRRDGDDRRWNSERPPSEHVRVRSLRTSPDSAAAWAVTGTGSETVVVVPNWVTHLTADWSSTRVGRLYRGLAQSFRVLRYDRPGTGIADRKHHDFSLLAELDLLDRVLSASAVRRVTLLGAGFAGPVAIAFAARYPGKVAHLVLIDTAAHITPRGETEYGVPVATVEALAQLCLADWGLGARTLSELLLPGATIEQHEWFTDYQRGGASPDAAASMLRTLQEFDVRLMLRTVKSPTLVLHRRDDFLISLSAAEALVNGIPDSRLEIVDGPDFYPWMGETDTIVRRVSAFLSPPRSEDLTTRETEIMHLVSRGLSNRSIGFQLGITETTVARHLANVYQKLDASGRIDALERLRTTEPARATRRPRRGPARGAAADREAG